MRVGIFQGPEFQQAGAAGRSQALLGVMAAQAARAAADGVDLLILPEMFLTGYHIGRDAIHGLAEAVDGASAVAAGEIARQAGVALLYGYPERRADGAVYNACQLVGKDGRRLANYRKIHLWGEMERAVFVPGAAPFVLAEVGDVRVGLLICYDVEFPEMVRGLALRGATLVAVPTATAHPYAFVPQTLVRARAYENQIFVAYANRCGWEAALNHTGLSAIAGPDGSLLAQAGAAEGFIAADLDAALFEKWQGLNSFLADRRPEFYQSLVAARP